jgi:hypothetical protein
VKLPRDDFLPHAGLPEDEHLGVRAGGRPDGLADLVDHRALTEQNLRSWACVQRRG